MMKKLWFMTPGAFPLDAFTTFGTNVKPNTTTPIGHFGTGLKYAVAIWLLLWKLQNKIKDNVDDPQLLAQLVRKEKEQTLEGEDLSFNYDEDEKGSRTFHSTVAALGRAEPVGRDLLHCVQSLAAEDHVDLLHPGGVAHDRGRS